jgi:hypothetical protein
MVAGQFPRRRWRNNPEAQTRNIEEAVQIAEKYGVVIPDDIEFHVDESGELNKDLTARGPRVDKPMGERIYWSDLVHDRTQKVPFRIWAGILKSDEAIVAVLGHEMYEIRAPRSYLQGGELSIDDYIMHTEPGRKGNLHDQAWEEADRLVDLMRGASRS